MAVRMIDVRNKRTGAKARLPESALRHLPDWQPTARQAKTDTDAAGEKAVPKRSPRKRATKNTAASKATSRKAASAAQDKE